MLAYSLETLTFQFFTSKLKKYPRNSDIMDPKNG